MSNVIVTGASRGLGLAMAERIAAAGYRVLAVARSETEELKTVAAAVAPEQGGSIVFRSCDLSDTAGIAGFVAGLRQDFGPIYGLINNAGLGTPGVLSMMRDRDIESLVRLNTLSPLILTKYVLRSMMVERAGRIINMSSIVSATGFSGLSACQWKTGTMK